MSFSCVPSLSLRPVFGVLVRHHQDDQDSELGGWEPMRQVQVRVAGRGATATQWRIHTPICAPSRSELQSKPMPHNSTLVITAIQSCDCAGLQAVCID